VPLSDGLPHGARRQPRTKLPAQAGQLFRYDRGPELHANADESGCMCERVSSLYSATEGPSAGATAMTDEKKADGEELSDDNLDGVSGGVGVVITSTTRRTASGEQGGTEDINIGVGELQECTISKTMD